MSHATLDHIVVTAPNLKSGVQWVKDRLGVTPEFGGQHLRMGTHNCLLRLADQTYLEVIATDPNAPKPDRPRWFGLDLMDRDTSPRLAAWVARTSDIKASVKLSTESLGVIEPMRRGELNWLITVTDDGALPLDGIAPILIQWQTAFHPSDAMRECGCRLLRLQLNSPDVERAGTLLHSIGLSDAYVQVEPQTDESLPLLVATVQTANGEITQIPE